MLVGDTNTAGNRNFARYRGIVAAYIYGLCCRDGTLVNKVSDGKMSFQLKDGGWTTYFPVMPGGEAGAFELTADLFADESQADIPSGFNIDDLLIPRNTSGNTGQNPRVQSSIKSDAAYGDGAFVNYSPNRLTDYSAGGIGMLFNNAAGSHLPYCGLGKWD
jgi:hypothetical protein